MAKVHGYCDSRFVGLKQYFQKALDSGEELGASLTINIDDKDVVDFCSGWRDREKTQPWQEDTIVIVFSTTKNISALVMLLCIERGLVSAHDKVSKYWPEFAVNGKDGIEIRHICHTHPVCLAGLIQ
jgi:CubicO group peptidase (beta-lactamase class C family)